MKKIMAAMMASVMVLSLAGCKGNTEGGADKNATYKLGMGVVTSIASSSAGKAQVDATVATVVTDDVGKIVSCKIDVAQNKMEVADGAVPEDAASATFKTKKEKGDEYAMRGASPIGKEWFEQAEAFEQFVVGKTAAEVAAIPTETLDNGHVVTTDETLLAGCTMSISDMISATVKACNDDGANTFTGDAKLAIACTTKVDSATKSAADGEDGVAAMYTSFAAVAVDADGKLAAVCYDEVQPKVTFDAAGEITSDTAAEIKTKREKKDEYNMRGASAIGKEWFEQNQAFEDFVTGKTASEISAIPTETLDNGHVVTSDETLYAGCTMSVGGMIDTVVKSVNMAG
ncbi:MAG: hypothetical protein ACI4Q4_08730 [Oscillospiraceae bacterium]